MPEYRYEGVERDGRRVSGKLNASTEGDLRVALRAQGIRPTRISRAQVASSININDLFVKKDLNFHEVLIFTRQLQVLISSGIPLVQALDILSDQATTLSLKNLCVKVRQKVSEGSYLWEALSAYPKSFSRLYLALIRAGESSGTADQMLKRLTGYMEDTERLRKMLVSAMMYPAIVIVIGIAVIAAMMIFVIPKFEDLLKGSGQELPGPTRFIINTSHYMMDNWMMLSGVIFGGGFLIYRFFSSNEGKVLRDRLFFRMPLFGGIMQKGSTARFTRTLSTLLSSGVNLLDSIDICQQTVGNAVLEDAIKRVRGQIEQGQNLSTVFGAIGVFPKMATQMIAVGETTGQVDRMLEKVSDYYEAEVEVLIQGLTKLIEPFILVFLGGIVGGMLIAMYLPIFKMGDMVQ